MSFFATPPPPKTLFNDGNSAVFNPLFQVNGVSSTLDKVAAAASGVGAVSTIANGLFEATSGTSATGVAAIQTNQHLEHAIGQSEGCRFSTIFGAPSFGNIQFAGLLGFENRVGFSFFFNQFGIQHARNGVTAKQELLITSGASGSEVAVLTLDGTSFNIPLTIGGTTEVAAEIAEFMRLTDPTRSYESTQNLVRIALLLDILPTGSFSFSSATAAGTVLPTAVGVSQTLTTIFQSDFNINTVPNLNPLNGNLYQVTIQNMGFGDIVYSIYYEGEWVDVHRIEFANNNTSQVLSETNLPIGWTSINIGGSTSVSVKGQSAMGFTYGDIPSPTTFGSELSTNTTTTTAESLLLLLRNPNQIGNRFNRVDMKPLTALISTDSNKQAIFTIYRDPVLANPVIWSESSNSTPVQSSKVPNVITSGELIKNIIVTNNTSDLVDLIDTIVLTPGQTLGVTSRISGGGTSETTIHLSWSSDV